MKKKRNKISFVVKPGRGNFALILYTKKEKKKKNAYDWRACMNHLGAVTCALQPVAIMPLRIRVCVWVRVCYFAYEKRRDGDNIHIIIYTWDTLRLLHDIEGRDRTYFQVTVVLLTAQIHQGIRLSPLKVLVSLVFRPASNLLLRLLRICNNAMFALLHSKRHVSDQKERD